MFSVVWIQAWLFLCTFSLIQARRRDSTQLQSKKLKILRLPEVYTYSVSLFMFKLHHNMLPLTMTMLFTKNNEIHSYNTRGSNNLRNPKIRTKIAEKFISNSGVKILNNIKDIIDPDQKIGSFKRALIIHLIKDYGNWQFFV